jgi:hypothetical protein
MRKPRPLTNEEGEVRELLIDDLRQFRPAAEVLSPSLAEKVGIGGRSAKARLREGVPEAAGDEKHTRKRKSGVPTGNAGEYFVMAELLRRGFDAQLADRNTKGYDLLVGKDEDAELRKVQVKTVRAQPWYVNTRDFSNPFADRVTVYVLLGPPQSTKPVRYFIAKNGTVAEHIHRPKGWKEHGFMPIKAIERYEDRWEYLLP